MSNLSTPEKTNTILTTISEKLYNSYKTEYEKQIQALLTETEKLDKQLNLKTASPDKIASIITESYTELFGQTMPDNLQREINEAIEESYKIQDPQFGTLISAKAIKALTQNTQYDMGQTYKSGEKEFKEAVKKMIETGDRTTALENLKTDLYGLMTTGKNFAQKEKILEWMLDHYVSRANNFSTIAQLMTVEGVESLRYIAILDKRTSTICKNLNGRVIEKKVAYDFVKDYVNTKPEDIRSKFDYTKNEIQNYNKTDAEIIADLAVKVPPLHLGGCRTTLVASFYKTATTTKEAENIAKDLRIAKNVNYEGLPLYVANQTNETLVRMKEKHGKTYETITTENLMKKITVNGKEIIHSPIFTSSDKKLTINKDIFDALKTENIEKINKAIERDNKRGHLNAKNLADLIIHDFGHKLTALKLAKEKAKQGNANIISDEYKTSKYSELKDSEKLAEIFVLIEQNLATEAQLKKFNEYSEIKL